MKKTLYILIAILFLSCEINHNKKTSNKEPNILFIIADDMGKDALAGYTEGTIKPHTPNIDSIGKEGLSFNNFWTYPTCSPTRASMITGKYGYRTNVRWANQKLSESEILLQKYINKNTDNSYATAVVGKWHISGYDTTINPEKFGIDYYAGIFIGSVKDYYNWPLSEKGKQTISTEYTTKKFTDLASNWIKKQEKPWFMWLAYNAPHTPFHIPPAEMHSQGNLPPYTKDVDPTPYFMASIEAMDFQIGKLLNSMSKEDRENTLIIFMGDNGTEPVVTQAPYTSNQVKRSLYQGGINMPLFVSGKGVERKGMDNNLITSTDIFATIAEIAGVEIDEINDSKSFKSLLSEKKPIRKYQYSEMKNEKKDAWTISNGTYKLLVFANGKEEMYNLINDPYEKNNILNSTLNTIEKKAKEELEIELLRIRN
ncbi:sulfatase-like hydrolase/transferase [Maribacter polysaccharolyticus]|uniref:sulfatase-like hydrolase/transferase n=1 Tax=Maribacter polysaccharolyticus TaxID=3020831 RepID=UPI00237F4DB9|nr:sulfatase-like hydrolase/transferase [Maribacter polysaccharolyticus]MDE3741296.1 sulfatase-like hydrolase/transferase [Maribacter polysaccharolyticus]